MGDIGKPLRETERPAPVRAPVPEPQREPPSEPVKTPPEREPLRTAASATSDRRRP
jgi:hypothetical protein